ncbi:MAG: hypothetical protein U9N02_00815 [Campylobacterota bacterium]|nr:hypothetical protein [Campylobacterota bacterium]
MHTIKLQLDDSLYSKIVEKGFNIQEELNLVLKNLASKKISYIDSEQFKKDKKYFQNELQEIENGTASLLSQEEYDEDMNKFLKTL